METGQSEKLNDLNYIKFGIQLAAHFLELFILGVGTHAATETIYAEPVILFAESPTAVIYETPILHPFFNLILIIIFFRINVFVI